MYFDNCIVRFLSDSHAYFFPPLKCLANATEEQLANPEALPACAARMLYILAARNFDDVYQQLRTRLDALTRATDDNERTWL